MSFSAIDVARSMMVSERFGNFQGSVRAQEATQPGRESSDAKESPYAALLERAATGGPAFREDMAAIVREVERIDSGEAKNRDELQKLLDFTAEKSRNGEYGGILPPQGLFLPSLFA